MTINSYRPPKATDLQQLKQMRRFLDERLALEREREKKAESRANATLGASSVLAGLIALGGQILLDPNVGVGFSSTAFYFTALLFTLRSAAYCLYALRPLHVNRLTDEFIDEVDEEQLRTTLTMEIGWKRWELAQLIGPTSERLFYMHRAQRNILGGIFFTLIVAFTIALGTNGWMPAVSEFRVLLVAGLLVVFLLSDRIAEHLGIWERESSDDSNTA